jgi:8-oxo-dGTP diphosphatase
VTAPDPGRRDYPARPLVGVGAVVLADEAARANAGSVDAAGPLGVLIVKRRFEPLAGRWSLPGGLLETGETLVDAAAREILEETGLVVEPGPVIDVLDRIMRDAEGRVQYHYVLVDYLCRIRGGALRAGSDVSEVQFARLEALPEYAVTPQVEAIVRRAVGMHEGVPS